jgi:two-component system OmpR family response regulator
MSTDKPRLLVVEDEADLRRLLKDYFDDVGEHECSAVPDAEAARRMLRTQHFDVVIVDLGLPGENGLDLVRYLREHTELAIMVLTGRGASADKIAGLELGADDYLVKPVELRELLARVRSLLRRRSSRADAATRWTFFGWTLDLGARALVDRSGKDVPLSSSEFDLLQALLERPGVVLNRDRLLTLTRGRAGSPLDRSVDMTVARLRKKLARDPLLSNAIRTVHGQGYFFSGPVSGGPPQAAGDTGPAGEPS